MSDPDRDMLGRFAATFVAILLFGATVDPVARAPFLAGLFVIASCGAAALAAVRRHSIRAPSLTYWDQALAFLAASRVCRLLSDPDSYEALRQLSQTSGAR